MLELTPRTQYVREPDEIADKRDKLVVEINELQGKVNRILSDPWSPARRFLDEYRAELDTKRALAAALLWALEGD